MGYQASCIVFTVQSFRAFTVLIWGFQAKSWLLLVLELYTPLTRKYIGCNKHHFSDDVARTCALTRHETPISQHSSSILNNNCKTTFSMLLGSPNPRVRFIKGTTFKDFFWGKISCQRLVSSTWHFVWGKGTTFKEFFGDLS